MLWLAAAAISVLSFAVAQPAVASDPPLCNGVPEICDRPLDQVVLPGTHNSMSSEEYGWALPNQYHSIPTQLDQGIRAFLIDTHYGKPTPGAGVSNVADWNAGADGNPHEVGAPTYLCHSYCALGASPLAEELAKVTSFLQANPREVLVFVVQDAIHPDDYATAVDDSGLIGFVYTGSVESFPTLEQMIASNQRVVMLSEGNTGSVPWFHNGYAGPLQETPYNFRETANEAASVVIPRLTDSDQLDHSCRPNRGGQTGPLFLMNHWVNGIYGGGNPVTPDPEVSKILNQKDVLVNRARACEQRRGKLPTIVAIDQFGDGDLIGAVDELNGATRPVDPEPEPEPEPRRARIIVQKPKVVRAVAGRPAVFRIPLRNAGNAAAPRFRVCARAPRRLVRRANVCLRVTLRPGQRMIARVRIPTRPRARGRGVVRFTIQAPNGRLTTRSNLVVRPGKSRRR